MVVLVRYFRISFFTQSKTSNPCTSCQIGKPLSSHVLLSHAIAVSATVGNGAVDASAKPENTRIVAGTDKG